MPMSIIVPDDGTICVEKITLCKDNVIPVIERRKNITEYIRHRQRKMKRKIN